MEIKSGPIKPNRALSNRVRRLMPGDIIALCDSAGFYEAVRIIGDYQRDSNVVRYAQTPYWNSEIPAIEDSQLLETAVIGDPSRSMAFPLVRTAFLADWNVDFAVVGNVRDRIVERLPDEVGPISCEGPSDSHLQQAALSHVIKVNAPLLREWDKVTRLKHDLPTTAIGRQVAAAFELGGDLGESMGAGISRLDYDQFRRVAKEHLKSPKEVGNILTGIAWIYEHLDRRISTLFSLGFSSEVASLIMKAKEAVFMLQPAELINSINDDLRNFRDRRFDRSFALDGSGRLLEFCGRYVQEAFPDMKPVVTTNTVVAGHKHTYDSWIPEVMKRVPGICREPADLEWLWSLEGSSTEMAGASSSSLFDSSPASATTTDDDESWDIPELHEMESDSQKFMDARRRLADLIPGDILAIRDDAKLWTAFRVDELDEDRGECVVLITKTPFWSAEKPSLGDPVLRETDLGRDEEGQSRPLVAEILQGNWCHEFEVLGRLDPPLKESPGSEWRPLDWLPVQVRLEELERERIKTLHQKLLPTWCRVCRTMEDDVERGRMAKPVLYAFRLGAALQERLDRDDTQLSREIVAEVLGELFPTWSDVHETMIGIARVYSELDWYFSSLFEVPIDAHVAVMILRGKESFLLRRESDFDEVAGPIGADFEELPRADFRSSGQLLEFCAAAIEDRFPEKLPISVNTHVESGLEAVYPYGVTARLRQHPEHIANPQLLLEE